MLRDIRIAVVICRCPVGQVERNLERTRYWCLEAKNRGAELVCFPELNLTGYSNRREIIDHAFSATGGEISRMILLAKDLKIVLLVGFAEKGESGKVYASHLVIAPNGKTAIYRKLHLAPPEVEHFCAGNTLSVFKWSGIRFGIQLCYDAHFPELATRMAKAGTDIIFTPHASPLGRAIDKHRSWMRHLPARAYDNGLFVVACNQTGDNGNGLVFPGNSMIISPSGEIIEARPSGGAGMLLANLKADQIDHVRNHRMRYFFPNRRPEMYRKDVQVDDLGK